MSERIISFVENWVSENIHAEGYPAEGEDVQAKSLAAQCRAEALAAGIPESEIDDEFDDLTAMNGKETAWLTRIRVSAQDGLSPSAKPIIFARDN
jgi:hypothetical protein